MNRRQLAAVVIMLGGLVLLVGGVLQWRDDGSSQVAAVESISSTTTSEPPSVVSTTAPTTTTSSAATTTTTAAPTTTAEAETTTTTAPTTTTTTTLPDTDLVEAFIVEFAAALESGDVDFVFASLHPGIVFGFGTELCRTWVETQIMGLSDYQQTGPLIGPSPGSLSTPGGDASFDVVYSAPVSFGFSGASFDANADFVVEDGIVYFTGACEA